MQQTDGFGEPLSLEFIQVDWREQGAEGTENGGILLKSFVFDSSDFVANVQRLFSLIPSLGAPSRHTAGKGPGQALSCSAAQSLGKSDFCGMNPPSTH